MANRVIALGFPEGIGKLEKVSEELQAKREIPTLLVRAYGNLMRDHFIAKNQVPNKPGFPRQYFWAQIRDSVQSFRDGDDAVVQVNDPRFNQKVWGGVIKPKEKDWLAIPVHPIAYGRRASSFPKGELVWIWVGPKGTKQVAVLAKPLGDNRLETYYWLTKSVRQDADPTALPPTPELEAAGQEVIKAWVETALG